MTKRELTAFTAASSGLLRHMSTDDLRAHLARAIEMTTESIAYLAAVAVELESRGVDLSSLKIGLLPYLKSVATGRLIPEALIAFAGQRSMLKFLESRPVEDQRAIAAGSPIDIPTSTGQTRQVSPSDATIHDLRAAMRPHTPVASTAGDAAPPPARRGRPPLPNARRHIISFSVTEDEHAALMRRAADMGNNVADTIRSALGLSVSGALRS